MENKKNVGVAMAYKTWGCSEVMQLFQELRIEDKDV